MNPKKTLSTFMHWAFLAVSTAIILLACSGPESYIDTKSLDSISASKQKVEASPPNIIFIVADQMRREAMGFWSKPQYQGALNGVSDPVVTPTLDDLAEAGVVFNQAVANFPLCSPFRGMLMSGMYPNKNGVDNNTRKDRPSTGLKTDIDTITEVLRNSGYNTALFGKAHWHFNKPLFDENGIYIGDEKRPGGHFLSLTDYDTYVPPGEGRHGIEYWYQSIGHIHKSPLVYSNDSVVIDGKKDGIPHYPMLYSSVDQANKIVDYINNSHGQRDSEKPFGMLWAMDPPHSPYESLEDTDPEIYKSLYEGKSVKELLNRPNANKAVAAPYIRYYLSMVTLIDREIGRVIQALKEQGIYKNTIIVFTADHGEMMGSHGKLGKNKIFEESFGIPLIVSYPEKLGHRVDDLLISVPDYMPTVLGLAGLDERIPEAVQGTNYAGLLKKPEVDETTRPLSALYYGKSGEIGTRTMRYSYGLNKKGELIALYDNKQDPYQMARLDVDNLPESDASMLKQEVGCWLERIGHDWAKQKLYPQMISYPDSLSDCQSF